MRIALIGAMDIEIEFLVGKLKKPKIIEINNFIFYIGSLLNHEIIAVKSGIGKVMSGILIATLVNNFKNLDKIINVGVAGGIKKLEVGDIVVGSNYLYGDVDLSSVDKVPYGKMANFPLLYEADNDLLALCFDAYQGIICTNDKFITNFSDVDAIIEKFPNDFRILCFDMESAAYAQACTFYHLPFLAIRVISDVIGSSDHKLKLSYSHNVEYASIKSNKYLLELLKKIN